MCCAAPEVSPVSQGNKRERAYDKTLTKLTRGSPFPTRYCARARSIESDVEAHALPATLDRAVCLGDRWVHLAHPYVEYRVPGQGRTLEIFSERY